MRLNRSMSFAIRFFAVLAPTSSTSGLKPGPRRLEIADEYLQELLRLTGQLIDDGDTVPIVEVIVLALVERVRRSGPLRL
jgi:hypothetical protein